MHPRAVYTSSVFDFVAGALRERPGTPRVLEAGCGAGDLAVRFKPAGYNVLALDISRDAAAAAAEKGVASLQGDILDYCGGPFDAIVFPMSLHHMTPLAGILDHAASLLKRGGLLVVEDFDYE